MHRRLKASIKYVIPCVIRVLRMKRIGAYGVRPASVSEPTAPPFSRLRRSDLHLDLDSAKTIPGDWSR